MRELHEVSLRGGASSVPLPFVCCVYGSRGARTHTKKSRVQFATPAIILNGVRKGFVTLEYEESSNGGL
jgi:hypothetical protein